MEEILEVNKELFGKWSGQPQICGKSLHSILAGKLSQLSSRGIAWDQPDDEEGDERNTKKLRRNNEKAPNHVPEHQSLDKPGPAKAIVSCLRCRATPHPLLFRYVLSKSSER